MFEDKTLYQKIIFRVGPVLLVLVIYVLFWQYKKLAIEKIIYNIEQSQIAKFSYDIGGIFGLSHNVKITNLVYFYNEGREISISEMLFKTNFLSNHFDGMIKNIQIKSGKEEYFVTYSTPPEISVQIEKGNIKNIYYKDNGYKISDKNKVEIEGFAKSSISITRFDFDTRVDYDLSLNISLFPIETSEIVTDTIQDNKLKGYFSMRAVFAKNKNAKLLDSTQMIKISNAKLAIDDFTVNLSGNLEFKESKKFAIPDGVLSSEIENINGILVFLDSAIKKNSSLVQYQEMEKIVEKLNEIGVDNGGKKKFDIKINNKIVESEPATEITVNNIPFINIQ